MSIQSKLSQLVDLRDTLVNTLNEYDIDLPVNSKLSTLLPYINEILVNNNIDKFIAKGRYNGDLVYTLSQSGELIVTGSTIPNNLSSNNPLYYMASEVKSVKTISVPQIGAYMFGTGSMFNQLENVVIGEGCTTINGYAFDNCTKLTSITLPESLKRIEDSYAFRNVGLKTITFPENLEYIGAWTFDSSKLEEVTIPNKIKILYIDTFEKTSNLHVVNFNESLEYLNQGVFYESDIYKLDFPDNLIEIGNQCFTRNKNLTEILFNEGLKYLRNRAFYQCTSLEEIVLPDTLTTIEYETFYECTSLTNANIPKNMTFLDCRTFMNCTSLEEVSLNCTKIYKFPYEFFRGCTSLDNVEIPNTFTYIDYRAFNQCTSLSNIKLPDNLLVINYEAFYQCSSLEFINIPNGVYYINYSAFHSTGLKSIRVPESVMYLGSYNFRYCNQLREVIIKSYITNIYEYTFANCPNLELVEIPSTVTSIHGYAFTGSTQSNLVINIHNEPNAISGAPWGATNATINWLGKSDDTIPAQEYSIPNDFEYTTNLTHYFDFAKVTSSNELFNPVGNNLTITGYPIKVDNCLRLSGEFAYSKAETTITDTKYKTIYVTFKKIDLPGTGFTSQIISSSKSWSTDGAFGIGVDGNNLYIERINGGSSGVYDLPSDELVTIAVVLQNNSIILYVNGEMVISYSRTVLISTRLMLSLMQHPGQERNWNGNASYYPLFYRYLLIYEDIHDNNEIAEISQYLMNHLDEEES